MSAAAAVVPKATAAPAVATSAIGVNPVASKHGPASVDVVVVGAGLAGLTAANIVAEHGLKVVVVEASGYIGGRVKTHELLADYPIELGAEFVHGPTNALMSLVQKYGLETERIYTWAHGDGGPAPEQPVNGGIAYYWYGRTKKWVRFDVNDAELQAFHQALWDIEDLKVSDYKPTDSITDYLRKKGVNPRYFGMAEAGYSNTLCNNSSELSIIGAAKLFQGFSEDGEGELRILPSWQPLLSKMSSPLDVRLRWEAKSIAYPDPESKSDAKSGSGGKCTVTNAAGETIVCDRVVCCVPAPILRDRDIQFSPPLSAAKHASLNRIKADPCFKLAIKFSRKFWPADMHGCICSDTVVPEWWSLPTHQPPKNKSGGWTHFVLTGFTTSDYSRHFMSLPRDEVKRQALAQLDDMFGTTADPKPATNSFLDWATKDWGSDRFIKCGYTSVSMQSSEVDRATIGLPTPNERVFFAGEHCGVGRCMVAQAAIETGRDAGLATVKACKKLNRLPESKFIPATTATPAESGHGIKSKL